MRAARVTELYATKGRTLVEMEDIWRAILSDPNIAVGVVRLDPDGELRIIEANPAAGAFSTIPWSEAPGERVRDIMIPEVADYFEAKLRQCLATGEPQNYERAIDLPTGRVAWAANMIPVRHGDGELREIVAMSRPIPVGLHASGIDERNQKLVDGLNTTNPGLIYLLDLPTRRATYVGGQVEQLLGFKPYQLEEMGDPVRDMVHPDDYGWVEQMFAEIGQSPDEVSIFECRVRDSTGSYRRLSCRNRVLDRTEDGAARSVIGVATDMTDQSHLRDEVAALNSLLSNAELEERRVIAQELHDSAGQYVVAAELALIGAQERSPELKRNPGVRRSLDDVMECLKDAEREIRVLSYLLHPPAIAKQGLVSVIRNFTMGFGGRAGIAVDVSVDTRVNSLPEELAIPLLRICQEALTNVHRHAKAKSVSVRLDVIRGKIELEICDDGIGFSQEGVTDHNGYGVGLSGMRDRVARLGGHLDIHSNGGTTLKVLIPLR
ncbi:hypothetical protein GCM10023264_21390 [Sphingomonas daechungensis]|uniref:PAS domain-containing sensor histidine kinase n=1 Tax=Sphingomonas daechungensis TaxID=1176646 RepID=UPI0031E9279D